MGSLPTKAPGRFRGGFREGSGAVSGAGSEPRVLGQVSGDRVPPGRFQNGSGQVSRL